MEERRRSGAEAARLCSGGGGAWLAATACFGVEGCGSPRHRATGPHLGLCVSHGGSTFLRVEFGRALSHMIRRTRTPSGHISGNRQRALLRELMAVEHSNLQRTGLNAGRTGQRHHKGICNPCIRAAHRLAILSAPVAWSVCRVHIFSRLNERPTNAKK